jgi:hypothetical protein
MIPGQRYLLGQRDYIAYNTLADATLGILLKANGVIVFEISTGKFFYWNVALSDWVELSSIDTFYTCYCFRETFIGNAVDKTFQLTGNIQNGTLALSWNASNVRGKDIIGITEVDYAPVYDSVKKLNRNQVKSILVSAGGLVTTDYAPRLGVTFYIWYWYTVPSPINVTSYNREDFVGVMEINRGRSITLAEVIDLSTFAGGVPGPPGPPGISIVWLGSFATPPVSPNIDEAYYNTVDGISYIWNGSWYPMTYDGTDGTPGLPGTDGNTILNGVIDPITEGVNGDFYINTATNFIFGPKAGGVWPAGVSIIGAPGAAGLDGKTVLSGIVDPTTEGADGDFYINTITYDIFGPKTGGVWGAGTSLIGPPGPAASDHSTLINRDIAGNHAKLIPAADGTTAIQITKADGSTYIINVDTTNGRIGIGNNAPDALLHIVAGTLSTPPVKLTSGDLNTTSQVGAIEFKDDDIHIGISTPIPSTIYTSQYPSPQDTTTVKATTNFGAGYEPWLATDPTKLVTGGFLNNSWVSNGAQLQRFHIDLGVGIIVKRIYYENAHGGGLYTDAGVRNFTLWGSNSPTAFAELTYAVDTDWTQLTTAVTEFDQHEALDQPDPKYIIVTNTTSYQYYAFKFADSWAGSGNMGIRRVELQDASPVYRRGFVLNDGANLTDGQVPVATTNGRLIDSGKTLAELQDHEQLDNLMGGDIVSGHYHSDQPINIIDDVEFNSVSITPEAKIERISTQDEFNIQNTIAKAAGLGKALDFNGSTDRVLLSALPAFANADAFTYTAWVKVDSAATYNWIIRNQGGANGISFTLVFGYFGVYNHSLDVAEYSDTILPLSVWQFIGVVYDGAGGVTFYLNGNPDGTGAITGTWTATNVDPEIGALGGGWPFDGCIDEVVVYDYALTNIQMAAKYNGGSGVPGTPEVGLVGGWHFDEGTGLSTADFSGNLQIGTLSGPPAWVDGKIMAVGSNELIKVIRSKNDPTAGVKGQIELGDVDSIIRLNQSDRKFFFKKLLSEEPDGASAVAFELDTEVDLSTAGALLLKLSNLGVVKLYIDKDGNIGVGILPDARLHLAAGTSVIAPFKLTSGVLLSTTEQGSLEYNVDDLYFSIDSLVPSTPFTSQYPPAYSDTYVKSTSNAGAGYEAYLATNPALNLTGGWANNSWGTTSVSSQRLHIDLGSGIIVKRIYYENGHSSGGYDTMGAKNFTFWGSNTPSSFADLTYGSDAGWTELTVAQNQFDKHEALDQPDPKYILVANTTSYQYYAIKIVDNWGEGSLLGIRRIELQDAVGSSRRGVILNDGTNLTDGQIPVATTNGRLIDSGYTVEDIVNAVDITYADLVTAIGASTLVKGALYKITDYKTVHNILYSSPNEVYTLAPVEALIVIATGLDSISSEAYSLDFPNDIIKYDVTGGDTRDISFFDSGTPIAGLKGIITYREDTIQNVKTHYDFRNVKFRRWKVDLPTYDIATNYSKFSPIKDLSEHLYISRNDGNLGNALGDPYWLLSQDLSSIGLYWSWLPTAISFGSITIPVDSTDYVDVLTFGDYAYTGNIDIGLNEIDFLDLLGETITRLNNIVFKAKLVNLLFYNISIASGSDSTIYGECYWNKIGHYFKNNVIGIQFIQNILDDSIYSNLIADGFEYNEVKTNFTENSIGQAVQYNKFAQGFIGNLIGASSNYNIFETSIQYNNICNSLADCHFLARSCFGVDFTQAMLIYESISKEVFKLPDGSVKLRYVDDMGNYQIADATSTELVSLPQNISITYNGDGTINVITEVSLVGTRVTTFTYTLGLATTIVTTLGGNTETFTITRDGSGNILSTTKVIS